MFYSKRTVTYRPVKLWESHGSLDADNEDAVQGATWSDHKRASRFGSTKSLCIALAVVISTISLIVSSVVWSETTKRLLLPQLHRQRLTLSTCGRSPQEATRKGCVFDVILGAWMRPECYDEKLHRDYFHRFLSNYTYFLDAEGIQTVSHEELFKGQTPEYWVSGAHHFAHCSYIWEKQLRQMGKSPKVLDARSRNWYHSLHCATMLARADLGYLHGQTHARRQTESVDCIIGDWTSFDDLPAVLQSGSGPAPEEYTRKPGRDE